MSHVDGSVRISAQIDNAMVKRGLRDMQDAAGKWADFTNKDFQSVTKSGNTMVGMLKTGAAAFAGWKVTGFAKEAMLVSGIIDSIFDGAEFRLDRFFKNLIKQLTQIAMNRMFAQIIGGFFPVRTAHTGGVIGVPDANPSRRVSPLAFLGAPRYHAGGIAGLMSNEVPAILQRGEGVFTKAQMRALGAGLQRNRPPVNNITIHAPPGTRVETQERGNSFGGLDTDIFIEMIDSAIAGGIASGRSKTAAALQMRGY